VADNKPVGIDSALFQLQASATHRLSTGSQAGRRHDPSNKVELEQASRQFESLLLNFMIREMRATVPESGLFPASMAQDMFTSMLDEQYADSMAERGGIGLHRLLVEQLTDTAHDK
jgi:flagellar protein FlgJ